MLAVDNLQAFYGKSHVLHGVDLEVGQGEIVSLLGRNGVGRSTPPRRSWAGRLQWPRRLQGARRHRPADLPDRPRGHWLCA